VSSPFVSFRVFSFWSFVVVVAIAADLRSLWLAVPKEGNHFGCGSLPAANHSLASGARRPACRPLGLLIDHPPCPLERPCFWRLAPVARRACLCPLGSCGCGCHFFGGWSTRTAPGVLNNGPGRGRPGRCTLSLVATQAQLPVPRVQVQDCCLVFFPGPQEGKEKLRSASRPTLLCKTHLHLLYCHLHVHG
jgi:hypothetical protein